MSADTKNADAKDAAAAAAAVARAVLPTTVRPKRYTLDLTPDLDKRVFSGRERVELHVVDATSELVFNAVELEIALSSVRVHIVGAADGVPPLTASAQRVEEPDIVHLTLSGELAAGADVVLELEFTGVLNDKMCGFYASKSTNADGAERWLATTQFEAVDARRAFPCWDEPALKASFKCTLRVPDDRVALSNMPVVAERADDKASGVRVVEFDETPVMSTYLLAFFVGDAEYVSTTTDKGVLVRVYTPPGRKAQGEFALNVAAQVLSYFADYYDIAYPLPKLDMIAIPDFGAGAMENWGLVTYRETALLIDEATSGQAARQRVAYVVAHELAHQWFGNLVTMEWWKELWLNEGFATYAGTQAVAHLHPEWDVWTQFLCDYFSRALALDELETSHPVEVDVAKAAEINEIFDLISYCKGASVVRMVASYLGEEAFRNGLRIYLAKHKYSNAVTTDLWAGYEAASGKEVTKLMAPWTQQTGFPLLTVRRDADDRAKLHLSQRRFLASGKIADPSSEWPIVLNVIGDGGVKEALQFDTREHTVTLPSLKDCAWIKANADQSGFFRVLYADADAYDKFAPAIKQRTLGPIDRLGLIADAFALAKSGVLPTERTLALLANYGDENDYTVISEIKISLSNLMKLWSSEDNFPAFQAWVRALFSALGDRLGCEPRDSDGPLDNLLRVTVMSLLGGAEHESVVEYARKRFAEASAEKNDIQSDMRMTIYSLALKAGGEAEFDKLLTLFRESTMSEEKVRCLSAIGSSPSEALAKRALEFGLNSGEVRDQDIFYVINSCASNPKTRAFTWQYVKDNWKVLDERFGAGQLLLQRIAQVSTTHFTTTHDADDIEAFFKANPCPQAERTIGQVLESMRAKAAWLDAARDGVAKFFVEHQPKK